MGKIRKMKEKWYFLSFRDPKINKNLGCCNVCVKGNLEKALEKTKKLGINPGGEVAAYELEEPELKSNKLYSRKEMLDLEYSF
jgi:hypothetical protein